LILSLFIGLWISESSCSASWVNRYGNSQNNLQMIMEIPELSSWSLSNLNRFNSPVAGPIISNKFIYFINGTKSGSEESLFVIALTYKGEVAWKDELIPPWKYASMSTFALSTSHDGTLALGMIQTFFDKNKTNFIIKYNLNGSRQWEQPFSELFTLSHYPTLKIQFSTNGSMILQSQNQLCFVYSQSNYHSVKCLSSLDSVLEGSIIYILRSEHVVSAFDISSGKYLWSREITGHKLDESNLVLGVNSLYVTSSSINVMLFSISKRTGDVFRTNVTTSTTTSRNCSVEFVLVSKSSNLSTAGEVVVLSISCVGCCDHYAGISAKGLFLWEYSVGKYSSYIGVDFSEVLLLMVGGYYWEKVELSSVNLLGSKSFEVAPPHYALIKSPFSNYWCYLYFKCAEWSDCNSLEYNCSDSKSIW
jgi:outer membrane protein assembly factor BamB